jgi:hypothetical protein
MPSTSQYSGGGEGNQVSNKGFEPTSYQSAHKGFEPYKSNQSISTSNDNGNKGTEVSVAHQGFKPFTNNQRSTGFIPSAGYQNSQKEFEPSKDNQAHHVAFEPSASHGYANSNGFAEPQKSVPVASVFQMQTHTDPATHMQLPNNYLSRENSMSFSQQLPSSQQHGYSPHVERSSAGRPPHALVAFGFGGKLVVMNETSSMTANFDSGNQVSLIFFVISFFAMEFVTKSLYLSIRAILVACCQFSIYRRLLLIKLISQASIMVVH